MDYRAGIPEADLNHILAHTGEIWRELAGKRLFITGGTGFFGIWLLESIAAANRVLGAGVSATVLSRNPAAFLTKFPSLRNNPAIDWIAGDVRSFEFPHSSFSHIIHAATSASAALNTTDPGEMFSVIVDGTRRILDFAAASGTRKLLLMSSGAVYGTQPPTVEHTPEESIAGPDPTKPANAYAEGKRAAELLCAIAAQRGPLEVKIARGFAFVGPHLPLDAHFAVGNFIRDALAGGPIVVSGDGTPLRSYMHAADATVWCWHVLVRGTHLRPYNIGSDHAISIADLARTVAECMLRAPSIAIAARPNGTPPTRYVPHIGRAKAELGLDLIIPLDEAIARTVAWATSGHRSA